ncbi:MAG: hypothetical protein AAFR23_03650 [Pseudomonadota bacterium]
MRTLLATAVAVIALSGSAFAMGAGCSGNYSADAGKSSKPTVTADTKQSTKKPS